MTLEFFRDIKFRAESLATIETANKIIDEYRGQGFSLTLRQLYYQFVARGLIENTERSYKNLGNLIAKARDAGLVSWTAVEDRTRQTTRWGFEEDETEALAGIEYGLVWDFWGRQDYYVEAWIEKEALVDVLRKACEQYRVPHLACKGYLSASEAWRAGKRFERAASMGKHCILLHLGDHDPSGLDMTRDNDDRSNMYSYQALSEVRRLALNMDQVEEHNPPPNPTKMSDSRAPEYVAQYGHESWELDALEPKLIVDLITAELESLTDQDRWDECEREQEEAREKLVKVRENWDAVSEFLNDY